MQELQIVTQILINPKQTKAVVLERGKFLKSKTLEGICEELDTFPFSTSLQGYGYQSLSQGHSPLLHFNDCYTKENSIVFKAYSENLDCADASLATLHCIVLDGVVRDGHTQEMISERCHRINRLKIPTCLLMIVTAVPSHVNLSEEGAVLNCVKNAWDEHVKTKKVTPPLIVDKEYDSESESNPEVLSETEKLQPPKLKLNLEQQLEALKQSAFLKNNLEKEKTAYEAEVASFLQGYMRSLKDFLVLLETEIAQPNNALGNEIQAATEGLTTSLGQFLKKQGFNDKNIAAASSAIEAFVKELPSLTTNQKLTVAAYALVWTVLFMLLEVAVGALLVPYLDSQNGDLGKKFWEILTQSGLMEADAAFPGFAWFGGLVGVMGIILPMFIGGMAANYTANNLRRENPLIEKGQAMVEAATYIMNGFTVHQQGVLFNTVSPVQTGQAKEGRIESVLSGFTPEERGVFFGASPTSDENPEKHNQDNSLSGNRKVV